MKKVSIVVPIFNAADTIADTVESICRQTYDALDIVLIDDGSQDASGSICDEWAARDRRVHVVHQQNQGRSVARWHGVEVSVGEWLTFVDADDRLMPHAVELMMEQTSDATDIVMGNSRSIGAATGTMNIETFRHHAVRADGTIGVPWGSLYRRSVLSKDLFDLPREIYNGEDYIFWLRLVFKTTLDVATLAESVYMKGEEHTSNSFRWSSDYCEQINLHRMAAIPAMRRDEFLADAIADRIVCLCAATLSEPRSVWQHHDYYVQLLADIQRAGISFTPRQRIFLALPSRWLRKCYSLVGKLLHRG